MQRGGTTKHNTALQMLAFKKLMLFSLHTSKTDVPLNPEDFSKI